MLDHLVKLFWPLLKDTLSGINIKIDAEARTVTITKGESTEVLTFDEIEKAVNQYGQIPQ